MLHISARWVQASPASKTGQLLVVSLIFHCASSVSERSTPKTGRTCRPVEVGPVAHQNCSTACRLRVSLFPKPERHSAPLFRWAAGNLGTALARQCRGNEVTRRIIEAAPLTGLAWGNAGGYGARACAPGPPACCRDIHPTHFVGDPPVIYSGRTGNPETLCWK